MYHFESFLHFRNHKNQLVFPLVVNCEFTQESNCEIPRLHFLVDAVLFPGHKHRKIKNPINTPRTK
jgi:hypothetical protein